MCVVCVVLTVSPIIRREKTVFILSVLKISEWMLIALQVVPEQGVPEHSLVSAS